MKAAISKLTKLGFSEYEAKAYTALLQDNPLTAYEIAKNSGIPSSKVYEVIRKLEGRNTVQSIRAKRSRLYIPVTPDELVENYKLSIEESLNSIKTSLSGVKIGVDTNYTWHIKEHDDILRRAKRMVSTARTTVLILVWPEEISALTEELVQAQERGIKIAVIHYGPTNIQIGRVYRHTVEGSLYAERKCRGLTVVADSKEALIGSISEVSTDAIWSMNASFVMTAEDYLRHDIYLIKTMERFAPLLKETFGRHYEHMVDVYND